ncbi:MAG: T9SS type A sorting domain-containing protein [Prevotella sp.]|nr:T9SS type A sorting domain-containing protein [Prevotella sp.]
MQKKILLFVAAGMLTFSAPAMAMNMVSEMGVAEQIEENAPVITVHGSSVSVNGGNGETLEIVSLTGKAVASYKIEYPNQRFELNLPKGCYILKVGKTVRKVTIK